MKEKRHGAKDYLQGSYVATQQMPQAINILSILSFIGSAFQIISGIVSYFILPFSVKSVGETRALEKTREMKPFSGFLKWSTESTLRQYEYRVPVLIVTIVAALICVWGIWQMRKLKKAGFTIYALGELAFPVFIAVVIDIWSSLFGFVVAVVFILLYYFQRKHLTE